MSAQFLHNRAFCKESTTSAGCVDFYTSMNTRYGAIREINAASKKNKIYLFSFVETLRKFIIAIINLRGASTKLNKYIVFTMQTYNKLIKE